MPNSLRTAPRPAFSETSLNIRKFTVHVLLKPGLENFKHYCTSVWDESDCAVVWGFFGMPFCGIGMKTDLFQSCGHCWVFQVCWHIECSSFTASSFRIWNSSTGILSPPLALFVVMLPKAHLTSFQDVWLSVSDHTIVIIWEVIQYYTLQPWQRQEKLLRAQDNTSYANSHTTSDTEVSYHPCVYFG